MLTFAATPEKQVDALPCAHAFHSHCLDRWIQYKRECPVCRLAME